MPARYAAPPRTAALAVYVAVIVQKIDVDAGMCL